MSVREQAAAILLFALLFFSGCVSTSGANSPQASDTNIGLFTSLPIIWQEAEDIRGHLNNQAPPHWALAVLRKHGSVLPIDSIAPSISLKLLILAQPRPLSPQENVALDKWVRGGGKILLFADPMLTSDSAYPLGDKRRPQDVVLLSPILTRWGLELVFDEDHPAGERSADWPGGAFPVNLPGQFRQRGGGKRCQLIAAGLGARCRIGKGLVLAIADAALLEDRNASEQGQRPALLNSLIERALAANRESLF